MIFNPAIEDKFIKIVGEILMTDRSKYDMHKYWGKKPAHLFDTMIQTYSKSGDIVLDPFSGYGVLSYEAYKLGRNVIANDLNPIANFIEKQVFVEEVDFEKLYESWKIIENEFKIYSDSWFTANHQDGRYTILSVLRDNNNKPVKEKLIKNGIIIECQIPNIEAEKLIEKEKKYEIKDWIPDIKFYENSRISAKKNMTIKDIFTVRTLACHARLFKLIQTYTTGREKDLLLLAFSANLANCSKLVPPIKSRGEMAPGAWMTGFYVGKTYIENNVLHYFNNRLSKVIKGKREQKNQGKLLINKQNTYTILNYDAKKLPFADSSIDYILTDPPYGDAVPYFEQSILWNSWMNFNVNYNDEIVISDSKDRKKKYENYDKDMHIVFNELQRVLKDKGFLTFTFNSISSDVWKTIINSCLCSGFQFETFSWLTQATFAPRQLNRPLSIKGDMMVTVSNSKNQKTKINKLTPDELSIKIIKILNDTIGKNGLGTNDIFLLIIKWIFENRILIEELDIFEILRNNFVLGDDKHWRKI